MIVAQQPLQNPRLREYKRWLRVSLYIIFLLAGECTGTILGRLYFDRGGKSKWISVAVQTAGFPVLLPLLFYFPTHFNTNMPTNDSSKTKPKLSTLLSLYLGIGLLLTGIDSMFVHGLLYLPLSTFALIIATQLAFSSIFSYFLNSQKFTPLILNCVVLLMISVSLLAINVDSEDTKGIPKEKQNQLAGLFFTLGASALFALHHSLVQLSFEKVIKIESFSAVLEMQLFPDIIAASIAVVGLLLSGEWKILEKDMREFENGKVSYLMTLFWAAVTWQISCIGMLGCIFEVSSLFSIVIGAMELPIAPFLGVIIFHDKITGVKIVALLLAIWGFLSYLYQHYLDDQKAKEDKSYGIEVSKEEVEI